jgi:hypothetical protein
MKQTMKKTRSQKTILGVTVAALLLAAAPASAALLDRGPQDPTLTFPQWYRDLNGTALGLCTSQLPSPNALAGGAPMCFPSATDPAGFAGNLGGELFYSNLNVLISKGAAAGGTSTFALRYVAALEASYLPAGVPIHGTEAVFARIRIVMNTQWTGQYVVTHPYGVEVFDVTDTGPRAVFFTVDVPLATPMNFDDAIGGRVGPFPEWDVVDVGLTLVNSRGEQFLGDPSIAHTFKGSPFGTNFVEVVGPVGSNLDGNGSNTVKEILGFVVGQKWLAPIATKFHVDRAVYATKAPVAPAAVGQHTIDVWASSAPGQTLLLTAPGLPSLQLKEYLPPQNVPGTYYGHVEIAADAPTPSGITVTNVSGAVLSAMSTGLVDQVDIALAIFDPVSRVLTVNASTSDVTGPALVVEAKGFPAGIMTPGAGGTATFTSLALGAGVEPPPTVRVVSAAGGVASVGVSSGTGAPDNQSGVAVAVSDGSSAAPLAVAGAGPTTIPVLANDSLAGAAPTTIIVRLASLGTATAKLDGTVDYTPRAGVQGTDTFDYVIQTAAGISNVATVTVAVPFVAPPPVAVADNFAMLHDSVKIYNVSANDLDANGARIVGPIVVIVSPPASGALSSAVANADGTITYTPRAGFNSALDTFTYKVAAAANPTVFSAPVTVTVDVFGGSESVSMSKAGYAPAQSRWTLVGSTNWFNAALTQGTATCYLTGSAGVVVNPPRLIGTAPIDTTGKFQLVTGPNPVPTGAATVRCITSYGGFKDSGVVIK